MTDGQPVASEAPAERPATRVPRKKPTPAAKASRWVAAGAAVGASLAMVGTMAGAAASGNDKAEPAEATTIRRVVVPQPVASEPIVIVLPQQTAIAGQAPAVVQQPRVPAMPDPAPAPAAAPAKAPVAESGGS